MACLPTYKGKRYKSLTELQQDARKINSAQISFAQQIYGEFLSLNEGGDQSIEGFKKYIKLNPPKELQSETKETYTNTLNFIKANQDVISHLNVYALAVYENSDLADTIEVKEESDSNENVVAKSFHENPELHQWAMDEFSKLGIQLIEQKAKLDNLEGYIDGQTVEPSQPTDSDLFRVANEEEVLEGMPRETLGYIDGDTVVLNEELIADDITLDSLGFVVVGALKKLNPEAYSNLYESILSATTDQYDVRTSTEYAYLKTEQQINDKVLSNYVEESLIYTNSLNEALHLSDTVQLSKMSFGDFIRHIESLDMQAPIKEPVQLPVPQEVNSLVHQIMDNKMSISRLNEAEENGRKAAGNLAVAMTLMTTTGFESIEQLEALSTDSIEGAKLENETDESSTYIKDATLYTVKEMFSMEELLSTLDDVAIHNSLHPVNPQVVEGIQIESNSLKLVVSQTQTKKAKLLSEEQIASEMKARKLELAAEGVYYNNDIIVVGVQEGSVYKDGENLLIHNATHTINDIDFLGGERVAADVVVTEATNFGFHQMMDEGIIIKRDTETNEIC